MELRVGTSGYSCKEWRGAFYPLELPAAQMLAFYAQRFGAVEINSTFYRMPTPAVLAGWAADVPDDFRFVITAGRRITHLGRLADVDEETALLLETVAALGDKLGLLRFELPPDMTRDDERLAGFLDLLPAGTRAAFEFRHASWLADDVFDLLRAHDVALVAIDADAGLQVPLVRTASFAYLRLRKADYADAELVAWSRTLAAQDVERAWVFFEHDDEGKGPGFARRLKQVPRM